MRRSQRIAWCVLGVAIAALAGALAAKLHTRWRTASQRPERRQYTQRVSHYQELPSRRGHIVMLGDSLTDYGEWSELLGRSDIVNRGIAGDTVEDIRGRLAQSLGGEPQAIALMAGINDLRLGSRVDELAEQYDALVADIQRLAPQARVLVQSVLPVREDVVSGPLRNRDVEAANSALAQIARERGAAFLDIASAMRDERGQLRRDFTADGVHLTGAGYRAWADALAPSL